MILAFMASLEYCTTQLDIASKLVI